MRGHGRLVTILGQLGADLGCNDVTLLYRVAGRWELHNVCGVRCSMNAHSKFHHSQVQLAEESQPGKCRHTEMIGLRHLPGCSDEELEATKALSCKC